MLFNFVIRTVDMTEFCAQFCNKLLKLLLTHYSDCDERKYAIKILAKYIKMKYYNKTIDKTEL